MKSRIAQKRIDKRQQKHSPHMAALNVITALWDSKVINEDVYNSFVEFSDSIFRNGGINK